MQKHKKYGTVLYDKNGECDYDRTDFRHLAPAGLGEDDVDYWLAEFVIDAFHCLTWHPLVACYHRKTVALAKSSARGW